MKDRLLAEAARSSGVRQQILSYCATNDPSALFAAIEAWAAIGGTASELMLLQTIDFPDLDWSGRHDQLISLLSYHEVDLANMVLGGSSPPVICGIDKIDLGDVDPWLEWLLELVDEESEGTNDRRADWVAYQLRSLIARSSAPQTKAQLLAIIENGEERRRWAVGRLILPKMENLTLADFSPRAIDFLTSLIARGYGRSEHDQHVFAQIADEAFVRRELFPLAANEGKARDAVDGVARQVGKRLGIRLTLPSLGSSAAANRH